MILLDSGWPANFREYRNQTRLPRREATDRGL
jgi:nitrogen fixation protein